MGKILIVDDALFMRQVIRGILKRGGYTEVLEAGEGEQAVALCREGTPDLVILDITMPNMDGIETLRQLKELDSDIKVIMCSAVGQEKLIMRAIETGAADYIVKPFKPEDLLLVVDKLIS